MKITEKLTVGQLRDILNSSVNDSNKDDLVVIVTKPLSGKFYAGGQLYTTCNSVAYFGFDWDSGKFFIEPSEHLFNKNL